MRETDFAYYLTRYFTSHLADGRNVSPNTVKSYRDTFKLLLLYFQNVCNIPVHKITIKVISYETVVAFLEWLENDRKNSISTRNQRLAAVHAFFRYLQIEKPDELLQYQRILSVPIKKCPRPIAEFLTPEMLKMILDEPDRMSLHGRRDLTILSILYDTGARVQELCDVRLRDFRLNPPATIRLTGKGDKTRTVPLMKNSVSLLQAYLSDNRMNPMEIPDYPLFFNQQHNKMTRGGIAYIIDKYAKQAREKSSMIPEKISPHAFRHTKAMHLYQSGIPLIYIRDILGHVDLATTQIYAKLDTELKRDALEQVYPELTNHDLPDWNDNPNLLDLLLKL